MLTKVSIMPGSITLRTIEYEYSPKLILPESCLKAWLNSVWTHLPIWVVSWIGDQVFPRSSWSVSELPDLTFDFVPVRLSTAKHCAECKSATLRWTPTSAGCVSLRGFAAAKRAQLRLPRILVQLPCQSSRLLLRNLEELHSQRNVPCKRQHVQEENLTLPWPRVQRQF